MTVFRTVFLRAFETEVYEIKLFFGNASRTLNQASTVYKKLNQYITTVFDLLNSLFSLKLD